MSYSLLPFGIRLTDLKHAQKALFPIQPGIHSEGRRIPAEEHQKSEMQSDFVSPQNPPGKRLPDEFLTPRFTKTKLTKKHYRMKTLNIQPITLLLTTTILQFTKTFDELPF